MAEMYTNIKRLQPLLLSTLFQNEKLRAHLTYILSVVVFLLIWHVFATYIYQSVLFSTPTAVFWKLLDLIRSGTLIEHIAISLQRILIGFILGSLLGIPIGLIMGVSPFARRFFDPYIEFFRFIPPIAFITLAVIWFGIGEESKIFLIIYTTVFIIIINTAAGVLRIPENKMRAARCLGASSYQVFLFVAVPATVPFILTGMRIAMGNSFATIVSAEMLGANAGIGTMIWTARLFMLVDEMFVGLIVLGVLGFITDRVFRALIYKFARKYSTVT